MQQTRQLMQCQRKCEIDTCKRRLQTSKGNSLILSYQLGLLSVRRSNSRNICDASKGVVDVPETARLAVVCVICTGRVRLRHGEIVQQQIELK